MTRPVRRLWSGLQGWWHSPLLFAYELRFIPSYWRIRYRITQLRLFGGKHYYSVRTKARSSTESTSIFYGILKVAAGQFVLAGILVFATEYVESQLRSPSGPIVRLASGHAFVETIVSWFQCHQPAAALSSTTLSTLAQIAGLFLALYFTTIGVVAGTNYARVPTEILDALVRERVGNFYTRLLALFGGVSLMLLALSHFGHPAGVLSLSLVSLLGILSMFSFVTLGRRAFYFFDPTELVKLVSSDIAREVRSATCSGFRWRDATFQNTYRRRADSSLRVYEDVVLPTNKENSLQGRSLQALAFYFLGLLELYSKEKIRIPSDSYWFERKYRHRSWLTAPSSRVDIAIQTGTGLTPESEPDQFWFEKRLGSLISRTFKALADTGESARAITVSTALQETLGVLSGSFSVGESLLLFVRLRSFAREIALRTKIGKLGSPEETEPVAYSLALADISGAGFISILLGFANKIDTISPPSFSGDLNKTDFRRPRTLYEGGFPRPVVEQLEDMRKKIDFERRVEGRQVSPQWYCLQLAALSMVRYLVDTCETLLAELETTFAVESETLAVNGKYLFAAQITQRGLEACNKFHFRVEGFNKWFESFAEFRKVPDIPWPSFDEKNAHERIEAVRDRLLLVLAQSAGGIAALPATRDLPDHLGQAYVMLADECYRALVTGDEGLFQKLFQPFIAVAHVMRERLREELKDYNTETAVVYMTEPLEDLLTISGYARIYAELEGKNFWNTATGLWDKLLGSLPDVKAYLTQVLTTIAYRRQMFTLFPRGTRRTAWNQELMDVLRRRGLARDVFGAFPFNRQKQPEYPSPLIRTVSRGVFMTDKPADIFAALYFLQKPDAQGIEIPDSIQSFLEEYERNTEEMEEGADETE